MRGQIGAVHIVNVNPYLRRPMPEGQKYTVVESDYLEEQDGLVKGAIVDATRGEGGVLYVTHIGEKFLLDEIPVLSRQLVPVAA